MAKGRKNGNGARHTRSRRGKGKDFTGGDEEKVEVRMGGQNTPTLELPSPEDFDYHMKSIKGANEKKDSAVALVRNAKKSAEKTLKGLSGTIDRLIKLERSNDPLAFQREMELLGFGLRHTHSPVQITVFDTLLGDENDQVAKRGYEDGKAGRAAKNDYPEGSDLHTLYAENWARGAGENLGLTADQTDAALEETTITH
jgi:hypothetical protein